MKVAIVLEAVFPENKGGLERWFSTLSQTMAEKVDSIHYLNSAGVNRVQGNLSYISITNHKWSYLSGGIRSIKQAIQFLIGLIKWFSIHSYDFLYISSVPILSIFVIPIVKLRNPRTVIVVEWLEYWPLKYWCDYKGKFVGSFSWFIQLVALQFGDFRITFIKKTNLRVRARNLYWIRNRTVMLPGLVNEDSQVENGKLNERNDITFLGRLVEEKQPLFALRVVEQFIDRGWTGTFWLVGTGPEEARIKQAIEKCGKQNQIKFLVNASDQRISELFSSSFLLLHPSKREGYGLVCVEAALKGLPSLLINYPENGAVDLEINPNLVSKTEGFDEILTLMKYARDNFQIESAQSINWATAALQNKTTKKSVDEIVKLVVTNV
jgi:glycosyltransferase involved in cell wall biosynthesis